MVYVNKAQRQSLKRVYDRYPETRETYREFRARVQGGFGYVIVYWCGMWLGIEPCGYVHS